LANPEILRFRPYLKWRFCIITIVVRRTLMGDGVTMDVILMKLGREESYIVNEERITAG
jgi:hypothetical protein